MTDEAIGTPGPELQTLAQPSDNLTPEQRAQFIEIEHPDVEARSQVTRAAFVDTWRGTGWTEVGVVGDVDPTTGTVSESNVDPDAAVIVQTTEGTHDDTEFAQVEEEAEVPSPEHE
jgi:hypothetical protein